MKRIILWFAILVYSSAIFAQTIREVVFFGDSLSDNGNLYRKVKIIPKSPPYYAGQFSNGPVWSERLKMYLEIHYDVASQNYAVGGATAVRRSVKDALPYYLQCEIDNYLASNNTNNKNDVLYFFWIGANDYIDEKKQPVSALTTQVIDEIISNVKVLIEHGGKNFVLIDLPDLAKTPFAKNIDQHVKDRLSELSALHHQKILAAVELLKRNYPTFQFLYIDAYSIFSDMLVNMPSYNQRYGKHIVYMTDSCWVGRYFLATAEQDPTLPKAIQSSTTLSMAYSIGTRETWDDKPCENPDNYLFWDGVHPTAEAHDILASIAIESIEKEFHF